MNKYIFAGTIASLTVIFDQISKAMVRSSMPLWSSDPIFPNFFNMVHAVNKGAAFGFLNRADISWQRSFFIIITIVALGIIYSLIKSAHKSNKLQIASLALLLGGAIGNLFDRIIYGEVTDFLDFYIGKYHWPAFNVADIALTIGAVLMIISLYFGKPNAPDNSRN